jgi:hypothetical protein
VLIKLHPKNKEEVGVKNVKQFSFVKTFIYILLVSFVQMSVNGQDAAGAASVINRASAKSNYQKNLKKYKDNSNFLVLPGLVADKADKSIVIDGEITELTSGEPSELFVIYDKSSHGYEALAYSFARPADIIKALKFLGMTPGKSVDSMNRQLWPKGERVLFSFVVDPKKPKEVPMKNFVIYTRTGKTPEHRLSQVFTGSVMVDDFDDKSKKVLMADYMDPYGIATSYTEPGSIMTTPDNVSKGTAYGSVTSGPLLPPKGTPIKIVLRPEYTDGKQRMQYFDLNIATNGLGNIVYKVKKSNAADYNTLTLDTFLKQMIEVVEDGHDPFVKVEFDKNLSIGTIKKVAALLQEIESVNGIRIDVPAEYEPFYRTFLPNEQFRVRKKRYSQPCELWLSESNNVVSAKVIKPTATYLENQIDPNITIKEFPVKDLKEFKEVLNANSDPEIKVLLIFVPENMQYSKVYNYIRPIMKEYPTLYIFEESNMNVK